MSPDRSADRIAQLHTLVAEIRRCVGCVETREIVAAHRKLDYLDTLIRDEAEDRARLLAASTAQEAEIARLQEDLTIVRGLYDGAVRVHKEDRAEVSRLTTALETLQAWRDAVTVALLGYGDGVELVNVPEHIVDVQNHISRLATEHDALKSEHGEALIALVQSERKRLKAEAECVALRRSQEQTFKPILPWLGHLLSDLSWAVGLAQQDNPVRSAQWWDHIQEAMRELGCVPPLPSPTQEQPDGLQLIAEERQRQIETEGWTPEHDDQHADGELASAARCYALKLPSGERFRKPEINADIPGGWPWAPTWWKPSPDPIRNLVKAGALIAAEIERLQRRPLPPPASKARDPE